MGCRAQARSGELPRQGSRPTRKTVTEMQGPPWVEKQARGRGEPELPYLVRKVSEEPPRAHLPARVAQRLAPKVSPAAQCSRAQAWPLCRGHFHPDPGGAWLGVPGEPRNTEGLLSRFAETSARLPPPTRTNLTRDSGWSWRGDPQSLPPAWGFLQG